MTSSIPSLSILAGAAFFAGTADAANVITNSSFNNDSGTAITGTNGTRVISGWGSMHLYNHTYNGTDGPKLGDVTNIPAYGVNDTITIAEASGLNGTYKGLAAPSQTVNLTSVLDSATLTAIAAGNGTFSFSSWMSGYKSDNNVVATRVRFFSGLSGSGITVGTFTLDRGVTTNQVTTADILVNPGGVNNSTSTTDTDYWALYEIINTVPTNAVSLTVDFVAGTGHVGGGSNDWYADHVVVDIIPEPAAAFIGSLGALGLLRRRRA